MAIEICLENFTGPLDLLLHLIKSQKMDIYDIKIVEITEQYLNIIDQMKQLDLDVAGEFLLMAAMLIHIKSQMLLPVNEDVDAEEDDPRAELVQRLLEYQRYKNAAEMFEQLPQLGRDIFSSQFDLSTLLEEETPEEDVAVGVYQLADAFHRLLKSKPPEVFHEVVQESLSVADSIGKICKRLVDNKRIAFNNLFAQQQSRLELIVTFLAILELVKLRVIKVEQVGPFSEIWVTVVVAIDQLSNMVPEEDLAAYG